MSTIPPQHEISLTSEFSIAYDRADGIFDVIRGLALTLDGNDIVSSRIFVPRSLGQPRSHPMRRFRQGLELEKTAGTRNSESICVS